MPNNCRDDDETAAIAAKYDGVEVIELHGITGRKAGALNAALDLVLPDLADDDLVVCMDADTIIHPDLLANASAHFRLEPRSARSAPITSSSGTPRSSSCSRPWSTSATGGSSGAVRAATGA